jgi:hypothetical protein
VSQKSWDCKEHITDVIYCRGDIPLKVSENFIARLNELEDTNRASPVILDENVTFTYIQYSNIYLLALSRTNSNAAAVLAFLHKIVDIFKHYFREVRSNHHCKFPSISVLSLYNVL